LKVPSNDNNSRLHAHQWDDTWREVGWKWNDTQLPVRLQNIQVSPYGQLNMAMDPTLAYMDPFEGSTFDTINRWNTYGSVAAVQTQGNLAINPGTSNNATCTVASQPTMNIGLQLQIGIIVTFETTTATGNHRFIGLGTATGNVGTAAAPLSEAVGFEIDTAGVLRASVYKAGTRVWTQALTMPTDGLPHILITWTRGDQCIFFLDDPFNPVATTYVGTGSQNLPIRLHSLNSNSVTGTPTMVTTALGVMDPCRLASGISDATYPWRRVKVDPQGALSVAPRAADLAVTAVGGTGNAVTCTLPAAGPGQHHYIGEIQITKYATAAISGNATPITITTTNLPGSIAYTFETAQAIGTNSTRNNEYALPLKSLTANTATTVVCPAVTNSLWRVTVSYYAGL
jgi:hypothetical protein